MLVSGFPLGYLIFSLVVPSGLRKTAGEVNTYGSKTPTPSKNFGDLPPPTPKNFLAEPPGRVKCLLDSFIGVPDGASAVLTLPENENVATRRARGKNNDPRRISSPQFQKGSEQ